MEYSKIWISHAFYVQNLKLYLKKSTLYSSPNEIGGSFSIGRLTSIMYIK